MRQNLNYILLNVIWNRKTTVSKIFNFNKQKNIGNKGEELFLNKYKNYEKLDKKNDYDFIDNSTGHKIELKTDTYTLSKTPNHFIERYSDDNKFKDGGPFRCKEKNSTFIYYHINDDQAFFYDIKKMIKIIKKNFTDKDFFKIRNNGYNTLGYKVPRELLKPALIKIEEWKDK